jgi:hypothetical protein
MAANVDCRIILMRNPGCQLDNIPYAETHYRSAVISGQVQTKIPNIEILTI